MGFPRQEYWTGLPFYSPRLSSQSRDRTRVSCTGRWIPYCWATREWGWLGRTLSEEEERESWEELVEACVEYDVTIQWAGAWLAGDQISLTRAVEKIRRGILRPPYSQFWVQAGSLSSTLRLMPLKIFHRRIPKADEKMRNASVNWEKKNHNLKVSWELCFIRQTFWGLKPKTLT